MNKPGLIVVGHDPSSDAFVAAALADGWTLLAHIALDPARLAIPPEAIRLASLEQIAGIAKVDCVVMAGDLAGRADRLRTVLRLEPMDLVLALPLADSPDIYYELQLVARETGQIVLPLLVEMAHPALARLSQRLVAGQLGAIRGVEWELPLAAAQKGALRFLDGWTWVRRLLGEVSTVTAMASNEDADLATTATISARTQNGALAQINWRTGQSNAARFIIECETGRMDCELPVRFDGPATLTYHRKDQSANAPPNDQERTSGPVVGETWIRMWSAMTAPETMTSEVWSEPGVPRSEVQERFARPAFHKTSEGSEAERRSDVHDLLIAATRQIELADAVRRSLARNRAISLTYDEYSEQSRFKSVMTASGCGMLWAIVLIAILFAAGVPYVKYLVLPMLVLFLLLQVFGRVYANPKAN